MIILDATTKKLQIRIDTTGSSGHSVVVTYVDNTTSAATPGVQATIVTTTGSNVDICAAPGASTQRLIKNIHIAYRSGEVQGLITVYFDNNGTDTIIYRGYMPGNGTMHYNSGTGWNLHDSRLNTIYSPGELAYADNACIGYQNDDNSTTNGPVSQRAEAVYAGICGRYTRQVKVYCNIPTTAGATITTAEMAIYRSQTLPVNGSGLAAISGVSAVTSLQLCGFTDTSAIINSTGQKEITINLTTPLYPGDLMWACTAVNATTVPVYSAGVSDDLTFGTTLFASATRPSTTVNGVFATENAISAPLLYVIPQ